MSIPESRVPTGKIDEYHRLKKLGIIRGRAKPDDEPTSESGRSDDEASLDSLLDAANEDMSFESMDMSSLDQVDMYMDELEKKTEPVVLKVGSKGPGTTPLKLSSMTWTTPFGLPIIQPYRKDETTFVSV